MNDKFDAVAVIIQQGDRFAAVKSVARGGKIGLVAGKVQAGESVCAAAAREALEESGIDVAQDKIVLLGSRDANGRTCALVLATVWSGQVRSSSEGECFWATAEELTGADSAYPEWNAWALRRLRDLAR